MKQLELRAYTRQEMSEITGHEIDKNFVRNVRNALDRECYGYEMPRGGDIIITKLPETPAERLRQLMVSWIGLDKQIDAIAFACYLHLMLTDEVAQSAPRAYVAFRLIERYGSIMYENPYIQQASIEKKLQHWEKHLLDCGLFSKSKGIASTLWKTETVDGTKWRTRIDNEAEDETYAAYKERRPILLERYKEYYENEGYTGQELNNKAWAATIHSLNDEFHCCYYRCALVELNAITMEQFEEILSVTTEIVSRLIATKTAQAA